MRQPGEPYLVELGSVTYTERKRSFGARGQEEEVAAETLKEKQENLILVAVTMPSHTRNEAA